MNHVGNQQKLNRQAKVFKPNTFRKLFSFAFIQLKNLNIAYFMRMVSYNKVQI